MNSPIFPSLDDIYCTFLKYIFLRYIFLRYLGAKTYQADSLNKMNSSKAKNCLTIICSANFLKMRSDKDTQKENGEKKGTKKEEAIKII